MDIWRLYRDWKVRDSLPIPAKMQKSISIENIPTLGRSEISWISHFVNSKNGMFS